MYFRTKQVPFFSIGGRSVFTVRKTWILALALPAIYLVMIFSVSSAPAAPPADEQGLWVANENFVSQFQGAALESSGAPDADLVLSIKAYFEPFSIAFDQRHGLWITNLSDLSGGDVAIMEVENHLPRLHLGGFGLKAIKTKRRLVIPDGPGVRNAGWLGLGFDAGGDLWIDNAPGQLLKIPFDRLSSKRPHPKTLISPTVSSPGALRFDSADNLWMVLGDEQVWRFSPGDRAASGTPNLSLMLDLPANFGVEDLAFDASGDLWLAGADFSSPAAVAEILMFSAADLRGSGQITPPVAVTITSSAFGTESGLAGGTCLGGIDFDHSGNLWASAHCDPQSALLAFTPSQLSTGGDLTPSITINPNSSQSNIAFPGPIRFGPALKSR